MFEAIKVVARTVRAISQVAIFYGVGPTKAALEACLFTSKFSTNVKSVTVIRI